MNNDGKVEFTRFVQHVTELPFLVRAGRMLVVIVESDLAVGHDLLVLREAPDDLVGGMKDVLHLVGMDADGGVDEIILVRKQNRVTTRFDRRADGDDIFNARCSRAFDHVVAVVIELAHLQVRMRVDEHC